MLKDRRCNRNAVVFFQRLSEAGDRNLLKREGNVECKVLLAVSGTLLTRGWVGEEVLKLNNDVAGFRQKGTIKL
jgi:hypothetical protein